MPSIMLFPLLPFFALTLFGAYWLSVAAMLYTLGEVRKVPRSAAALSIPGVDGLDTPPAQQTSVDVAALSDAECYNSPGCAFSMQWEDTTIYMGLYHLFGFLWTTQFIFGFGYVVLAAAIGHYYWYRGDSSLMPSRPVLKSMRLAMFYHLGSIALGSLIIAVIQFVRLLLNYLDRKTKNLQSTSLILKWCMCCVKCCMWYLEKVVKYINRNAYILIGVKGWWCFAVSVGRVRDLFRPPPRLSLDRVVHTNMHQDSLSCSVRLGYAWMATVDGDASCVSMPGTSYCSSAGRAVGLILSNVLRLAAVNVVGDFLIIIGKLCVVGCCGVFAFLFADIEYYTNPQKHPSTYLSSPVAPILLTVVVAYICATVFFQVYEMAVDTVLLCFCDDCDMNGDPKFAPPVLMEAMGLANEANQRREAAQFITSSQ